MADRDKSPAAQHTGTFRVTLCSLASMLPLRGASDL
jgi:hypothetical protein